MCREEREANRGKVAGPSHRVLSLRKQGRTRWKAINMEQVGPPQSLHVTISHENRREGRDFRRKINEQDLELIGFRFH